MLSFIPTLDGIEKQVRDTVGELAEKVIRPKNFEDDRDSIFRREFFNGMAQSKLTCLSVPKEFGGMGYSSRLHFACLEELAKVNLSYATVVGVNNLVQGALVQFGSASQKDQFLRLLTSGRALGAFSLSESQAGSDATNLRLEARHENGGYRLTGSKMWCTNAGVADLYLVMARTEMDRTKGVTAFLIPKETTGFRVGKRERKLGLRSSTLAELIFEGSFVPETFRIGAEGEGMKIALSQLDVGRIGIGASGAGVSLECLRQVFGQTNVEPGMKEIFADHYAALQALKCLINEVSILKDENKRVTVAASQIKLLGSELAMKVTGDAMCAVGPVSASSTLDFERMFRDAKALQIVEGTNQIQRLVLARHLET